MSSRVRLIYRPNSGGIAWGQKAFRRLLSVAAGSLSGEAYAKLTQDLLTDPRLTRVPFWQRALTIKQRYADLIPGRITVIREARGLRRSKSRFLGLLREHGIARPRRPVQSRPAQLRPVENVEPAIPRNCFWTPWEEMTRQPPPPGFATGASQGAVQYSTDQDGFAVKFLWDTGPGRWFRSQLYNRETDMPARYLPSPARRGGVAGEFLEGWRANRARVRGGRPEPAPAYTPPRIGVYR